MRSQPLSTFPPTNNNNANGFTNQASFPAVHPSQSQPFPTLSPAVSNAFPTLAPEFSSHPFPTLPPGLNQQNVPPLKLLTDDFVQPPFNSALSNSNQGNPSVNNQPSDAFLFPTKAPAANGFPTLPENFKFEDNPYPVLPEEYAFKDKIEDSFIYIDKHGLLKVSNAAAIQAKSSATESQQTNNSPKLHNGLPVFSD